MVNVHAAVLALSFRRSRVRIRVLRHLSRAGRTYSSQLASRAGLTTQKLKWVVHGHEPEYRRGLSLVPLGLVKTGSDANGTFFEITSRGRREVERAQRVARAFHR